MNCFRKYMVLGSAASLPTPFYRNKNCGTWSEAKELVGCGIYFLPLPQSSVTCSVEHTSSTLHRSPPVTSTGAAQCAFRPTAPGVSVLSPFSLASPSLFLFPLSNPLLLPHLQYPPQIEASPPSDPFPSVLQVTIYP